MRARFITGTATPMRNDCGMSQSSTAAERFNSAPTLASVRSRNSGGAQTPAYNGRAVEEEREQGETAAAEDEGGAILERGGDGLRAVRARGGKAAHAEGAAA